MHPHSIDLGLARVRAVARTLGARPPADRGHHRRRHQRQGLDGRAPGCAAARPRRARRPVHLAAPDALQRAHPGRRRRGRRCRAGRCVRAHRGGARRHHADVLRIQHAGGAADLRATRAVDVAVLEVGLGGRLDATNLVDADVAVRVLGRLRSSRLAGRHARADRRGEGRASSARGRPAVLGTPEMPASVYAAIARCGAQRGGRRAGFQLAAARRATALGLPRRCRATLAALPPLGAGRAPSSTAMPPRRSRRSSRSRRVPAAQSRAEPRAGAADARSRAGAARACSCPGASRSCRARSSGSSTSRTTSRPRACSPRNCARALPPARGAHAIAVIGHPRRQGRRARSPRALARGRSITGSLCALPGPRGCSAAAARRAPGAAAGSACDARRLGGRRAASARARWRGPAIASSCSARSTRWARRCSGFGYTKRARQCLSVARRPPRLHCAVSSPSWILR